MSLDGYIAGSNGESDWILMDPDIDFGAMMNRFDTILMGRRTFEATSAQGGGAMPGTKVVVVSQTLRQEDSPNVTVIGGDVAAPSLTYGQSRARTSGSSAAARSSAACSTRGWWMRSKLP